MIQLVTLVTTQIEIAVENLMRQFNKPPFLGHSNKYSLRLFPVLALTAALAACGGSDNAGPAPVDAPPQLIITSHQDGATITGTRTLAITANATDDKGIASVSAEWNGVAVLPANIVRNGSDIAVSVDLQNNANTLSITVTDSAGQKASKALALSYPFLAFDNGQSAHLVIGQASLDGSGEVDPQKRIQSPYGNPLVHQGRLYLPDYGSNRVMGYNSFPSANGAAADFVLGQTNFTGPSCTPVSGSCMGGPQSAVANGDQLLVTEYSNNRVLIFNQAPTASGAAAQVVVGQDDLISDGRGCSATSLSRPESAFVANGKLIVADTGNNRVLIWNKVPTANGTPADLVLGQDGFETCATNHGDSLPSASTLSDPSDVWSDGQRLFVADTSNHRVLIWNTFPTHNFTPANSVLGQANFDSQDSGTGAGSFAGPYFLTSNGNQLFVADNGNNRVLVWNTVPASNGAPADRVIGQPNFTANDPDAGQPRLNAQGLRLPAGLALHNNRLMVADTDNSRYVAYQAAD